MALVLGKFIVNKTINDANNALVREMTLNAIENLIEKLSPQINRIQDMYDTYWFVKDQDEEFAGQLWSLLCNLKDRNNDYRVNIDSYFGFGINSSSTVRLTRYGVSFRIRSMEEKIKAKYNITDKDLRWGKHLLKNYIRDFELDDDLLNTILNELLAFSTHFDAFANKFFESVSNYKIVE